MNIYLFVYYVENIEKTKEFLSNFGFHFCKEQHGKGPVHYSTKIGNTVFEIYPVGKSKSTTSTRIGFDLSLEEVGRDKLETFVKENSSTRIEVLENGKSFGVVRDPSGNNIEVVW